MRVNAMLSILCSGLIIGLTLASGVARGQSDPCNFNDGSTTFSYERVMSCYESVPFNVADRTNAVAFLRAARDRSDLRETLQARYNWRGELDALAARSFDNDHDFQLALVDNHKKLYNPHWSYRRPGCYTEFLASFIPFDFGSAVVTPRGGGGPQQIVFIEGAPYRADLYQSFTGIDANAYVGQRVVSINGEPALDYFRRFGTEVFRFDENAGQGLNEALQNAAYSLRISSSDFPADRAFDVFEFESRTGERTTVEVPWVFAPRSAFGTFQSPLSLSRNTQQFNARCLLRSSAAILAGSFTPSVPPETYAGGEEELPREIAEKRNNVRRMNESNGGPRAEYFEVPRGPGSELLPVIVPKRDSAVAYQLSDRATIIRLDDFSGDWKEEVLAATSYACSNSDRLIIDMRNNGGGAIDQVGWLIRHLLPERTAAPDHTLGGRFLSSDPGRNELVNRLTQHSGTLGGTCRYGYEPWCFIDPVTEQPLPADGWSQGGTTEVRGGVAGGVAELLTRVALFRPNRPKYSENNPIACPDKFRGRSLIIFSNGTGLSAGYFWPAMMRPDATIVTSGGFVGERTVFGVARGGAIRSMNFEAFREQQMIGIYGPALNPLPFFVRNVESVIEQPASYQRGSFSLFAEDPAFGDVHIDVWSDSLATDGFVYGRVLNAVQSRR